MVRVLTNHGLAQTTALRLNKQNIMKNIFKGFCWFLLIVTLFACNKSQEKGYVIDVKLMHKQTGKVYLEEFGQQGYYKKDSITLKDATEFTFEGHIDGKTFCRLVLAEMESAYLILDNINVEIEEQEDGTFSVKGGEDNAFLTIGNKLEEAYSEQTQIMNTTMQAVVEKNDTAMMHKIYNEFTAFEKLQVEKRKHFIDSIGLSPVALTFASSYLDTEADGVYMQTLLEKFKKGAPDSKYTKEFDKMWSLRQNLMIGGNAPDFELSTAVGKKVKLSDFKGKVVLIDFWASWCGPCRKENPVVVALYSKHKAKGFEILGVSLDDDKDAWMSAVKEDGITWTQVSDLKGWESSIAALYQVEGIPATFLIDKGGKIVAKGLRGKELDMKVGELLK